MSMTAVMERVKRELDDVDWANPYWLDEIKDDIPDVPEEDIDRLYHVELKAKIAAMSLDELRTILEEQEHLTSANQNYLLQHLIEERLSK
jgi:hypothetical protein